MILHKSILLLLLTVLGLAATTPAPAVAAAIAVGGFNSSRGGIASAYTGTFNQDARAVLEKNFIVSLSGTTTLTPNYLAGVDVLILSSPKTLSEGIAPLTPSEQGNLVDFVKAGGSALLIGEGLEHFNLASQSLFSPFGVSLVDDGLTGLLTVTSQVPTHPMLNGPFGQVPGLLMSGAGKFNNLGPHATSLATLDNGGTPVLAVIEANALGPGSGRVVLVADSNPFIDAADGGLFVVAEHQALFLNTFHYLATPEPTTEHLLAVGGGLAAIGAALGRRRRSPQRSSGA